MYAPLPSPGLKLENNTNLENIMKFEKYPKLRKHHETGKYEI